MILIQNLQHLAEQIHADDPEQRLTISGVGWQQYEALLIERGDGLTYRVTYIDGELELMSPSRRHESRKSNIGSLVEAYCQETRTRYFPLGSTTFRNSEIQGGAEPDESYCFETEKEVPDLAIEVVVSSGGIDKVVVSSGGIDKVVVSSGGIDKLEVYRRLKVKEVWFFQKNRLEVYHLCGETYNKIENSEVLPGLDLGMLAEYATAPDPLEALLEFRAKIRQCQE
jgi:Uma2 family endonuclease